MFYIRRTFIIKRVLFFFLLIYSLSFSVDEIDIEKRREEQQNFDKLIKSQIFERKEPGIENEEKDIILDITSIKLEGNTVFEDFQIESILLCENIQEETKIFMN